MEELKSQVELESDQVPETDYSEVGSEVLLSWQADEYQHHHKAAGWYVLLFLAVAGLVAAALWARQWSAVAVLVAMTLAIVVYAAKAPRMLTYSLTSSGVTVGPDHYSYNDFRSFAVIHGTDWDSLELDLVKRFMPRLTLPFSEGDGSHIANILSAHLPRDDRHADWVERLTRRLKF